MVVDLISSSKCFEGQQNVYSHQSKVLGCTMKFGVFLPPVADISKCPILYFLSGLTCTHENFIQKSGMQQFASKHEIIVVNPDTSPRDVPIPGDSDSYDFGTGAGFYVDATEDPWSKNYKMFSYVTGELIDVINEQFQVTGNAKGIFGHSMGGHGALICALKNPGLYQSVSAFAPICNPMECAWGIKAFTGYLGTNKEAWKDWDATSLATGYSGAPLSIFIDQGSEDNFLKQNQLLPENLLKAVTNNSHLQIVYSLRSGYDHSYFYISSFIGEHLAYHAKRLS